MSNVIVVSSGVTSDTTVGSGVIMDVFDSGSTVSITIAAGGTQSVYSGGVANQTTVDYGGVLSVGSGGIANAATVNGGGAEYVYAGGVANQTLLTKGASQYLSSGARAIETEIVRGGSEYVGTGATATDTVAVDGSIYVGAGGTTVGAHLAPAGRELVGLNGFASKTVISGGTLRLDGGTARGTVAEGYVGASGPGHETYGIEYVVNGASDIGATMTSGGTQIVENGGTTTGTIVIGGDSGEQVVSGGVAYGTRLYDDGGIVVSDGGRAIDTIVESGGLYNVDYVEQRGGTFGLLVSSGGTETMTLQSDRSTNATILAGGIENIFGGTAVDTKVYGSVFVSDNDNGTVAAVTSGDIIMSGGYEAVDDFAQMVNATVMSGGYAVVKQDQNGNGNALNTTIAGGKLEDQTSAGVFGSYPNAGLSGTVTFTGSGGDLQIDHLPMVPSTLIISGFVAGDSIGLPSVPDNAPNDGVVVYSPGEVTIDGQYLLNIAGAYVGESDFVLTQAFDYAGSILTKSAPDQMQFLRPHVAPTDAGLNLTPSLDMLTNPSTTTRPAAAPSMAASTSATIAPVPHLVTSAPHPLVVPPHGV